MKSSSLRESLSHSRHAHKVYPKTPAIKSLHGKLSEKPYMFDDHDDNDELCHPSAAAHLLEQTLMNDSPNVSSWLESVSC